MSDLTATSCGCNSGCANTANNCGGGCSNILWLIILLCFCGGNGDNGGCGGFFGNRGNDGCGCESIIWILVLLSCCGGGNGFC